jgi:hypothetical protein
MAIRRPGTALVKSSLIKALDQDQIELLSKHGVTTVEGFLGLFDSSPKSTSAMLGVSQKEAKDLYQLAVRYLTPAAHAQFNAARERAGGRATGARAYPNQATSKL